MTGAGLTYAVFEPLWQRNHKSYDKAVLHHLTGLAWPATNVQGAAFTGTRYSTDAVHSVAILVCAGY